MAWDPGGRTNTSLCEKIQTATGENQYAIIDAKIDIYNNNNKTQKLKRMATWLYQNCHSAEISKTTYNCM